MTIFPKSVCFQLSEEEVAETNKRFQWLQTNFCLFMICYVGRNRMKHSSLFGKEVQLFLVFAEWWVGFVIGDGSKNC